MLTRVQEDAEMNVSLGKAWERYVAEQVDSGLFGNASEVVRDALRRDVQAGVESVKAGRISRATPEEIVRKAKARKQKV